MIEHWTTPFYWNRTTVQSCFAKMLGCCCLIFRKLSLYPLHHWCNISVIAWVLNTFSIFLYVSFATSPAPADNSQLNPVAPACPFVMNLQHTKVNSSDKTIHCFYLKYVVATAVVQWDLLQCECCWWSDCAGHKTDDLCTSHIDYIAPQIKTALNRIIQSIAHTDNDKKKL